LAGEDKPEIIRKYNYMFFSYQYSAQCDMTMLFFSFLNKMCLLNMLIHNTSEVQYGVCKSIISYHAILTKSSRIMCKKLKFEINLKIFPLCPKYYTN